VADRAPQWGIDPVPERLRTFRGSDNALLWGSLGLSLLVLVAGTVLVPALSLRSALLAILIGGLFGKATRCSVSPR
jgi:purine-cytosine permease-like protein